MGGAMMSLPKKRLRKYRISWTYGGGMTMMKGTEVFQAANDKEARKKAAEITGGRPFELEQFRAIKNK